MMPDIIRSDEEYKSWIAEIKSRLRQAQLKAAVSVNTALLEFYWQLGAEIVEKQKSAAWGSGFLKRLSHDLMAEFPEMKGFSETNLRFIRRWYLFYNEDPSNSVTGCDRIEHGDLPDTSGDKNGAQAVHLLTEIPWGHNRVIISKCSTVDEALFYVRKTIENNWSRNVLTHQIESRLYERDGRAITNFSSALPAPQSDLAQQILKDPYKFDFLSLSPEYTERELEKGLIEHITQFLLELGSGFAYVGKQKMLKVGEREFFIDLLFYHTRLHCYVVIELKTGDFEPEYAGKLNFYLKAVDAQLKTEKDEPTVGILLCKSHDALVVEYALSDIKKPIGVSEYDLVTSLPEDLKDSFPTVEQLEEELRRLDEQ
ncbi:PDDEXK nuclease domain-containing protein [Methanoplanus endosymbiosus]|uniref:PDDEXK nuclease domain-containing protein n=1 Tax=Methanoplanus endosymbiosus TaxID=33865 RepID=A0A9E7THN5_9EURY|nr:PDDEXK nuclease domain-containing protein [Methanoplanus endosymbiosus]UUX93282.1 PDDEXK nuclease domain-containing protein [Methanoplanus endosymbiosus]